MQLFDNKLFPPAIQMRALFSISEKDNGSIIEMLWKSFLLYFFILLVQSGHIFAYATPAHLSCRGMCKCVDWSDGSHNIHFYKIRIVSTSILCEMGPRSGQKFTFGYVLTMVLLPDT